MTERNPLSEGLHADDMIDGRYRIVGRLGSGGMADVYCAQDSQLGRQVALKVLHRRFAGDQEFVERFRREASAAAGLQHPNIVQVFDRGSWDGTSYIAMELLHGSTLKDLVRDGPLEPARAVDITIQMLRAARFAHRHGVIHRDFKPHNVIVDDEGRVKVTDFGIARAGASDMTETGAIMGTAAYLSPEQAQGHAVSDSSDLYSVGIVLYELLTGRPPFDAETAVSIALKQVSEDPVPPRQLNPEVSPELEDVVLRALQKDPVNRFADADEFIAALDAVRDLPARHDAAQRTGPLTGMYPLPGAVAEDPERVARRSTRRGLLALLALVALAAIGVGVYLLARPDQVAVPKVVGQQSDVALARLNTAGFDAQTQMVRSADRPKDEVIRQRPNPGDKADKGSTVTIVVSSGPGQAAVPDVAGSTEAAATKQVRRLGFKPEIDRQFSDTIKDGRVIETRPEARTPLDIGQKVTIVVSRGPERVAVPDLTGSTVDDARSRLEGLGLVVNVARKGSDEDPGTVIGQDPAAGGQLPKGGTVSLTAAKARPKAQVPDVTGVDADDAATQLEAAGFKVRRRTQATDVSSQDGQVLRQSPSNGSRQKAGSTVTIFVGRFSGPQPPEGGTATPKPKPKPSRTPTPSPTPTPTP